jgi:hypothetical protein
MIAHARVLLWLRLTRACVSPLFMFTRHAVPGNPVATDFYDLARWRIPNPLKTASRISLKSVASLPQFDAQVDLCIFLASY